MIRPNLGVLVPYVSFYEKIAPVAEEKRLFAREVLDLLSREATVTGGMIETESEAETMGEMFRREAVDAVLVVPAVAAFGGLAWAALRDSNVPICIWSIQPDADMPHDYRIETLIRNSGGLAAQALGNTLARHHRLFRVVWSCGELGVPRDVRTWAIAAAISQRLRSAKFAVIGQVFPQMTDIAFAKRDWDGMPLEEISSADFAARYSAQSASRVALRCADMNERYSVSDLTVDALSRSARLSLALDEVVEQHALDGGAFNCHGETCLHNPEIGVTACYAVSRQTSSGKPFSCTGDIPTAIAMWLLHQLADWVIYGELDMVDPVRNLVLLANGGEGHFAAAANGVGLVGNENFEGLHGRGAALEFEPRSGDTTILSFTPLGRGQRLICADGGLSTIDLPNLRVFHAGFRFGALPAAHAFERWCEAGAVHHLALAPGHWSGVLREVARMRGFEFIEIGGSA
jgi:L-arabinose isomerase